MPVFIPPAGLTPAGLFVPQNFVDPTKPPGILADAIDPATNEYLSIGVGMDPIDAQVILALSRKRASGAAVMQDGQRFADIEKLDETAVSLIDSETRAALKRLLANGDIAIVSLTPAALPDQQSGYVALQYQNLRAKGKQQRTLGIIPS